MTLATLLVIEDDTPIRRGLADGLRFAGYTVHEAADGPEGLRVGTEAALDLILLDVMLPGFDGFELLECLRKTHPRLPVIMLTARGDEADRVRGFRRGCDDYVVKPFSVAELHARVAAVLRRSRHEHEPALLMTFAGLSLDLRRQEARANDQTVAELTEQEAALLKKLFNRPDTVVSREELLEDVWGVAISGQQTRAVDMLVARLREKLRQSYPDASDLIQTVRGRGYRLHADAQSATSASGAEE